eukprot:366112-Chlamydomonas_euryale.AAC.28
MNEARRQVVMRRKAGLGTRRDGTTRVCGRLSSAAGADTAVPTNCRRATSEDGCGPCGRHCETPPRGQSSQPHPGSMNLQRAYEFGYRRCAVGLGWRGCFLILHSTPFVMRSSQPAPHEPAPFSP